MGFKQKDVPIEKNARKEQERAAEKENADPKKPDKEEEITSIVHSMDSE
jgi:hypothetical protein